MNSKEAFKELKENAQEICEWELDRLKIIEKDLDRLEELEKENKLLKKDLKEYQAYIKKGVEEHYKDFMQDYDVLLEEYCELKKENELLEKNNVELLKRGDRE